MKDILSFKLWVLCFMVVDYDFGFAETAQFPDFKKERNGS